MFFYGITVRYISAPWQTSPPDVATAIGEGEVEVKNILAKEYKESMTIDDGLKLALGALKKIVTDGFDSDRIDCVYILNDKKTYEKMPKHKITKILASLDSKKK